MRLLRVKVPDFRVLKNVDIKFDKELEPNIFPVGSQNGGGKSTLLQLIFVLLHCSVGTTKTKTRDFEILREVHLLIYNMVNGFVSEDIEKKVLAEFEIADKNKVFDIEFFVCEADEVKDSLLIVNLPYNDKKFKLFCKINDTDSDQQRIDILENISEKIFLAAPSTHVYLFLPTEVRRLLFKEPESSKDDYFNHLRNAKRAMPGFFTYDFSSIDLLIEYLKEARDNDFELANNTGKYGDSYLSRLNELNKVLSNMTIRLGKDFSEIFFRVKRDGKEIEVLPEDLSHGELKRLSIYMWLRHKQIKDAIVLMDEIDIALHPDWQYRITSDLYEWEPDNQYILATHSYDLCQAVTPAHVKEIEPYFSINSVNVKK